MRLDHDMKFQIHVVKISVSIELNLYWNYLVFFLIFLKCLDKRFIDLTDVIKQFPTHSCSGQICNLKHPTRYCFDIFQHRTNICDLLDSLVLTISLQWILSLKLNCTFTILKTYSSFSTLSVIWNTISILRFWTIINFHPVFISFY